MALTFGFYNSIEGDRKYDAIQFGRIFDGIITDGVYATYEKGMVVKASDNAGEVIIQPGRAWFNHTWNYNDADYVMEAPAPEVLLDRIDALVLDINEEQAVRENSFMWVTGTPSSNPVRPTLTNTTTHHQYPLCYVRRYAETTMIYTKDITSMVGTSECPFVTGVLEGMDIDAWIKQWDDEFSTWEDATKVSFEAWMLTQQTDYTAWFNAVRDQLGTDMTEFEAWFETIKGIIDEEAATHLQAEIDEIKTMLPAGSHITITTTDTELFSRNVIIRDDFGHEITSKFDSSGVAVFETVPYVGSLTISSTDGIRTATNVVNTPYFARYEFPLAFWSAIVNIEGDEDLAGYTVTVYNSEETVVSSIVLNAEAKGVFNATYPDEFIFRITYGGETMEVSLDVREETTYTVTLSAGFNWRTWCTLGGVSTSGYSDLSDVFDDEVAVRRLMTVHASADYLIECVTGKLTTIDDFVANDTAMKWIGLRDYVCDGLTAITGVEAKFLASDYWERYLKDHVPVMTSASAPYGEVLQSGQYDGGWAGYFAFSDAYNKQWYHAVANPYLGYKFTNPIDVKCVGIINGWEGMASGWSNFGVKDFKLQYSDDGSSWNDAESMSASKLTIPSSQTPSKSDEEHLKLSTDHGFHLYWRVLCLNSQGGSTTNITINKLQFYGRALDVSVPVMTSNTSPYGEAFASREEDPAWKAFDKNTSDRWVSGQGSGANQYVGYEFTSPTKIKSFSVAFTSAVSDVNYNIQGYVNDEWIDLESNVTSLSINEKPVSNPQIVTKVRLFINSQTLVSGSSYYGDVATIQFYGVDYSEKEFEAGTTKKWLYDHGLEPTSNKIASSGYSYVASGGAYTVQYGTKNDDNVHFVGDGQNNRHMQLLVFNDAIAFANFSKIFIKRECSAISSGDSARRLRVYSTKTFNYNQSSTILADLADNSGADGTISLDVSAINSNNYVWYQQSDSPNTTYTNITELWLE